MPRCSGDELRDAIVLAVVALDDDLAIERERHDDRRLRRHRLGDAFADEPAVAVDGDRSGLERVVGRVVEPHRFEREALVAALGDRVVEVDDAAGGLAVDHRDHRARAGARRSSGVGHEVALADRRVGHRARAPTVGACAAVGAAPASPRARAARCVRSGRPSARRGCAPRATPSSTSLFLTRPRARLRASAAVAPCVSIRTSFLLLSTFGGDAVELRVALPDRRRWRRRRSDVTLSLWRVRRRCAERQLSNVRPGTGMLRV